MQNISHHFDGDYTVFGEVTDGLEVIDKIAALPVDGNSRPKSDAKIVRIYVQQQRREFKLGQVISNSF